MTRPCDSYPAALTVYMVIMEPMAKSFKCLIPVEVTACNQHTGTYSVL